MIRLILTIALVQGILSAGPNQTDSLSPVLSEEGIPFTLEIKEAPFVLPTGIQAYAAAIYKDKWILLSGRTNGLHGFDNIGNNFPPNFQNTSVYVVDPKTGTTISRSFNDGASGLSQEVIDSLSVTAAEAFQKGKTLYLVGGYGINTLTGEMGTKTTLTEIDLEKLLKWVEKGNPSLKKAIRQVSNPLLQVTGGFLFQNSPHDPFLLILGQNFAGFYYDNSNGSYTKQIRKFWIEDSGKTLSLLPDHSDKTLPDYRRRDLNVLPILHKNNPAYVAYAGVFTEETGVWTVPIIIFPNGESYQPDPSLEGTFKQAMNHYNSASFGLYSVKNDAMYSVFAGGISFGYFSNGTFETDSEIPFINQVTTVKIDRHFHFTQHLMNVEYPVIPSTGSNPGNPLLFGAEAQFFPDGDIPLFANEVIQLDRLKGPVRIGYIVGGIMSTLPNTSSSFDSTSSPYVFEVILNKKD